MIYKNERAMYYKEFDILKNIWGESVAWPAPNRRSLSDFESNLTTAHRGRPAARSAAENLHPDGLRP